MSRIGIMQGRLLPPEGNVLQRFPSSGWAEEFGLAALVPFEYIEWIYDSYGAEVNPLMNNAVISQLRSLIDTTGVAVRSVCADYFMDYPLLRCQDSAEVLWRLLDRCQSLGVQRLVLPFVDHSAIRPHEFDPAIEFLHLASTRAAEAGLELHLEMSLLPYDFAELLRQLPETVMVNYDSGNSASLGYRVEDEFAAIGTRVGSVHIKDRILGAGTVPLGTGNADFNTLFEHLRKVHYRGDFTLQVARGAEGDEVNWSRQNRAFLRRYWTEQRA